MTHTSTEQLEPRYADVVHHANVHPSLSYVARKTGLGYQETTRLLELALARGDLASGDYAGRNLDLYVADREKALTQEVEQLRARVQELEAQTAHMADLVELADYATKKLEASQAQRVPLPLSEILHYAGEQGFVRVQGGSAFHIFIDGTDIASCLEAVARDIERAHGITQEKQG